MRDIVVGTEANELISSSQEAVSYIARLDAISCQLQETKCISERIKCSDMLEALAQAGRRAKLDLQMVNDAVEIKIRNERVIGELLAEMPKHAGGRPDKTCRTSRQVNSPSYDELGIDRRRASRAQQMAAKVSDEDLEEHIAAVREAGKELSTNGVLKLLKKAVANESMGAAEPSSETCTVTDLEKLMQAGKQFGTIYADPPWSYGNQSTRAATDNHYETMSLQDIADLPISNLVADTAHLHLWTTNAFIFDCKAIMEAWGFSYRSIFVWVKPQMGIGNYWRVSHELMLLGVRGKNCTFRDRSLMSWGEFKRTKHSQKPELIRDMIQKSSPGPYLELFGRRPVDNWTVWGNQIESDIFHNSSETSND